MTSFRTRIAAALVAAAFAAAPAIAGGEPMTSKPFQGVKVSKGTVTLAEQDGKWLLTLSDDFVVPDTPAPHWQLVDSDGRTFLLNRLVVKGNVMNRTLAVPAHVKDIAKVQIWCAFAETLLGEAKFEQAQL